MSDPADLQALSEAVHATPHVNPYAPPGAPTAPVASLDAATERLEYAGFGVRGAARVIDLVVVEVVAVCAGAAIGAFLGLLSTRGVLPADWEKRLADVPPLSLVLGFVASTLYQAISEAVGGASVGKAILGLRVRSETGTRARFGATVLRSLAFMIDGFFFGAVAYSTMSRSPRRQRLGDRWGHTVVVRARSLPASARASSPLVGILLGCGVQAAVGVIDAVLKVF